MVDVLFETEQMIEQKRNEFLGDSRGRMRDVLLRIWNDKFKWGKSFTCCKPGIYDDLKEELEEMGFYVFNEMHYGEIMFCISWK
jgi:hypothetical protein